MLRSLFTAAALLFPLALATSAGAQEGAWIPKAQGSRLGGDIDLWPTDSANTVGFGIVGQIRVAPSAYIDFDVPWAVWDYRNPVTRDRGSAFVFGNPTVGAHWADTLSDRVSAHAGGSLTVSTRISDGRLDFDDLEHYGARGALISSRAFADVHRFLPDRVLLRGKGGLEVRLGSVAYYRLDIVPVIAIAVGERVNQTDFLLEVHNEFEARSRKGIGGGVRLQTVFLATDPFDDNDDAFQAAIEPYFTYEPLRGFYARLGILVALDRPLGFGLNDNKVATFRASLGGKW
jgi:hypothetical protein